MNIGRGRLNVGQKIAIWAVCLWVIWLITPWQKIGYALFEFALAGVVPGTKVVLSPDIVIGGVCFVLISFVLVTMMVGVGRFFSGLPATNLAEPKPARPTVAKSAAANSSVPSRQIIKLPDLTGQRSRQVVLAIYAWWWRYVEFVSHLTARVVKHLARWTSQGRRALGPLLHTLLVLAMLFVAFVWDKLVWLGQFIGQKATQTWRWGRPHLRQLDKWLEQHFDKLRQWWNQHINLPETIRLITTVARESKGTLSRVDLATIKRVAKTHAQRLRKLRQ